MLLDDCSKLDKGSHKELKVSCDFKQSENCQLEWIKEYRNIIKSRKKWGGKDICWECSFIERRNKRKTNGNLKYSIDETYFTSIDDEYKSYFLGFIASDGGVRKNTIKISIHKKDTDILEHLKILIDSNLLIQKLKNNRVCLEINSCKLVDDVCKHLKIFNYGKKCRTVSCPQLPENLFWHFLRGYFDGDGSINSPYLKKMSPQCCISSSSNSLLYDVRKILDKHNFKYQINFDKKSSVFNLHFYGTNCLDFLSKLYDNSNISLDRKHTLYAKWANWQPALLKGKNIRGKLNKIRWNKIREDAVCPSKNRASDSGYDLTILEKVKQIGKVEFYTTGIRLMPPQGHYFELVPRSSITKTGYMLANNIGILDRGYTGPVIVPLIKTDFCAKDLELPATIVQVIPKQIQHFEVVEVEEFENTSRGEGGFGASNFQNNIFHGFSVFEKYNLKYEVQLGEFSVNDTQSLVSKEDEELLKSIKWQKNDTTWRYFDVLN